ncbi:hypothetical protein B0E46_15660 [Rhodanobacter sp. B04]|nr:hypothetical protein B0E46_15660 [Rhodanobacter sp. B04]
MSKSTAPQILIEKAYITLAAPFDAASFAPLTVQSVASQIRALLKPDPNRFTSEPGSGIVYDPVTGLMWSQKEIDELEWDASSKACSNFKLGGYSDWYLPDRYEQLTILDLDRHGPCLPPIFETKGEAVWTSTQTAWSKGKAGSSRSFFYVSMYDGFVYSYGADSQLRARPVRRAAPASQ